MPHECIRYYAGVGSSSKTTGESIDVLTSTAEDLCKNGFVLRSGGADGADDAFERGAGSRRDIYYGNTRHKMHGKYVNSPVNEPGHRLVKDGQNATLAEKIIATTLEPSHWRAICAKGDFVKNLFRRNTMQILGYDLNEPVEFLVCYALPDEGKNSVLGGTKAAYNLARDLQIPTFNFAVPKDVKRWTEFVTQGYPPRSVGDLGKTNQLLTDLVERVNGKQQTTLFPSTTISHETISLYRDENAWLSNYYKAPITVEDITYPTIEHAFQAYKSTDPKVRQAIANLPTPGEARSVGKGRDPFRVENGRERKLSLRENWNTIKFDIMKMLIDAKFDQHPDLATKLMRTNGRILEEGTHYSVTGHVDTIWGINLKPKPGETRGNNALGKIHMEKRGQLLQKNNVQIIPVTSKSKISQESPKEQHLKEVAKKLYNELDVKYGFALSDKCVFQPGEQEQSLMLVSVEDRICSFFSEDTGKYAILKQSVFDGITTPERGQNYLVSRNVDGKISAKPTSQLKRTLSR